MLCIICLHDVCMVKLLNSVKLKKENIPLKGMKRDKDTERLRHREILHLLSVNVCNRAGPCYGQDPGTISMSPTQVIGIQVPELTCCLPTCTSTGCWIRCRLGIQSQAPQYGMLVS